MSLFRTRQIVAVTCIALTLALPAESQACWLTSCFCKAPAPVVAPVTQQVNYVPQTAYRTVYTPVAVTSYRPIVSTDPCSGCPVTSLAPVTTYVQRPMVVPYTTYRPVITTVYMPPVAPACSTCSPCATGACGAAPTAAYYAPAAYAPAPMVAPAPSCGCGAAAAPTAAYYAPTTAYYAPTTANYAPTTAYYGSAQASYSAPLAANVGNPTITNYPSTYSTTPPTQMPSGAPTTTYYNGTPTVISQSPVIVNSPSNGPALGSTGTPMLASPSNPQNPPSVEVKKPVDMNPLPPDAPKPVPMPETKEPAKSTGLFRTEPTIGPTTGMPMMRPWSYTALNMPRVTTAATVQHAAPAAPATDADGWHAAR